MMMVTMYLNLEGEGGQVVLMDVDLDEAALPLHRIVVSHLCILPIIEEDMSSLVRTQCSRSESQPGDEWGHLGHLGPIKNENGSFKPPQCIKLLQKSLRRSIS